MLLNLHFVSTKKLFFFFFTAAEMLYLEGKKPTPLKNICVTPKIMCIFRFFLEWLKLCSSPVLLIIVLITVLVMECLHMGTERALDLNACK